jgi:hypothetical protein
MTDPVRPVYDLAARRKRAARTALAIGGLALLVYLAFILSGVLAQ